ncbi:helix-turn-helix transcriptional regulator [Dasania sp. GY-MA-18]|uniref:response regulator transcription factor n=1 Tax=Dasania sp. GY-MA-18 TaxID=2966584 RepID=UPI0021AC9098|nr:helix-turn-helix transcriptional regulator [Dasania sp. GY-MA-18]MCR8924345.1 helix-turn-helix transcriptional regulator [Dasania sp. GY-MA-18]
MSKHASCLNMLGDAVANLGNDSFIVTLSESFASLDHIGRVVALYFPLNDKPTCLYANCKSEVEYSLEVEAYINGPYIFDPYYQASLSGIKNGSYRFKDIAPDNFKKTEFFRRYYKAINNSDELCYLVNLGSGAHIQVSISPLETHKAFTKSVLDFLNTISHIVTSLIIHHWQLSHKISTAPKTAQKSFKQALQQALKNFGSTLLTPREHDVLQLILHGHSNKATSERLDISLGTVKLHRKRIYQKLDISSQSELFYLFIDVLSSEKGDGTGDPLQAYMNLK